MSLIAKIKQKISRIKGQESKLNFKSPTQLKQKCINITNQYPILATSNYFNTHLPLIINPEGILEIFNSKLQSIEKNMTEKKEFQMQLCSILLSITEKDGLFYMFIRLWASFCTFQLSKIVQLEDLTIVNKSKMLGDLFHKQFFLLCFFIYQLSLYLYEYSFQQAKDLDAHELFIMIRNAITSVRQFTPVHEILRSEINCQHHHFEQIQVEQTMNDLESICQISTIPVPFIQSSNLLNEFCKTAEIQLKLKKGVLLIDKLKQQMVQYRQINNMNQLYIFCADDVFAALTYVMWRLLKNVYGPCAYIECVLGCQYEEIAHQYMSKELDRFGMGVQHSFQTIKSVATIGLLEAERVYSMI